MQTSAYEIASRFTGMKEVPGREDNPQILAMLQLDMKWPENDETPWCSGFANYVAWLLRLPRSKSLMARSWMDVSYAVSLAEARVGFDVVVLWRGERDGPSGHVGFFAGLDGVLGNGGGVNILGGNQGDAVTIRSFPLDRVLGVRRLWPRRGEVGIPA